MSKCEPRTNVGMQGGNASNEKMATVKWYWYKLCGENKASNILKEVKSKTSTKRLKRITKHIRLKNNTKNAKKIYFLTSNLMIRCV